MSNSFDNTAAQIALMSEDYDSIQAASDNVKAISGQVRGIDKHVGMKKGQKSAFLFAQIRGVRLTMDNVTDATPTVMGEQLDIEPGTFSTLRQVGSLMAYCLDGSDKDAGSFNSLDEAKLITYLKAVRAWYALETAGDPAAPNIENVLAGALSSTGEVACKNVQILRETFGSVSKLYTIMHGKLHPDADEPEGEKDDDATTWQGMLSRALEAARAQGAKESEIMFIVRAFSNGDEGRRHDTRSFLADYGLPTTLFRQADEA